MACPKCNSMNVTAGTAGTYHCEDCNHDWVPYNTAPRLPSAPRQSARGTEIRKHADAFTQLAVFSMIIGITAIMAAVIIGITRQETPWLILSVAVSLLGGAFWSFLIAQIIHIRANTEK